MASNRFDKLNKDKTKEIVGSNANKEAVTIENNVENPASIEPENKIEDTVANTPTEEAIEENTVANTTEEVVEETKEEEKKARTRNTPEKLKPKKVQDNKVPAKTKKFGVSVREDLIEKVRCVGEHSNNKKPNDVVIDLLKELFDAENNKFKIEFEPKSSLKVTSFNLPVEHVNAIDKISKKTGIPKSEVFNKLIEEALKDYF